MKIKSIIDSAAIFFWMFVASSLYAATEDDIRDIHAPFHIPSPWRWFWYALALFLILGLCLWAYRKWKNRKIMKPSKLLHEVAFEKLQNARPLMASGQGREYSIMVSDAVREYIEKRFDLAAAHHTTEEFLHNVLSDPQSPLTNYSSFLEDFLRHCDLAKFAQWSLSAEEMNSMYTSAWNLIEETRPRPELQNKKIQRPPVHAARK
jgi:hypothetical protein